MAASFTLVGRLKSTTGKEPDLATVNHEERITYI
jgi:hypothetical protein